MRTCKHCYKTFEDSHLCEVALTEITERDDSDLSPLIPRTEGLAAALPADIASGIIDES